jgi:hypothetical protein
VLAVLLVLYGAGPGAAQIEPESVERGKKGTALVEVSGARGDATGSAFCVDKSGLFITNAHVVRGASGKGGRIRLVLDSGLATQRILRARVLRRDDEVDLALLQVDAVPDLTPLELGRDADLKELSEAVTFGYPFGQMTAFGRARYPEITVLPSRITALRKRKGGLQTVQFDNQLNPGNSGGPVLDSSGKVIGVARAAVPAAALNMAIPVGRLAGFLATPGLDFEPPPLAYEDRARPQTWTIRVQPPTPVAKLPERLSVAVTIADGAGEPRSYTAQPAGGGTFTATVTPVPRDPERVVQKSSVTPRRVESIEVVVEARQGSRVLAAVRKRTKLTVATAGVARPSAGPSPQPVSNVLPILADERLLELGGMLNLDGVPRGAGKAIQPPRVAIPSARLAPEAADAPLVLRLDGTIGDVAVGGGGRFLLLALKEARKVAVFDVNQAAIVKTIPLPTSNVLIGAGARKVLLIFPDERLLQRWDLATLQRDGGTRPSPIQGRIRRLALGSDSDGPALVLWNEEARVMVSGATRLSLIDLDTLTVLKVGSISRSGSMAIGGISASGGSFIIDYSSLSKANIRASATGSLFAIWDTGSIPSGFRTLSVHGQALIAVHLHEHLGQLVPGPDGRTVFTGLGSRVDAAGKPIGRVESSGSLGSRELVIPSSDPSCYLSIGGLPTAAYDPNWTGGSPVGAVTVSVHSAGDGSRLLTVYGLGEMAGTDKNETWYKDDITTDKRFHLVPAAKLLITIPLSNDRLVLRQVDLDGALDSAGGGRLMVISPPALTATPGQKLVHRIVARSKKGGITFALARGPDGLEVAPDGTLTWMVPEQQKKEEVTAVVTVGDASGVELFHTLKIRVE